jgi:hypothetical protein
MVLLQCAALARWARLETPPGGRMRDLLDDKTNGRRQPAPAGALRVWSSFCRTTSILPPYGQTLTLKPYEKAQKRKAIKQL